MALGTTFVKSFFGVNVLKETAPGTYILPTKPLCLEKGKGDFPTPEFQKYTCDPMSAYDGDSYDVVTDGESGKVMLSSDIALPLAFGGVQDIFEACGCLFTDNAPDTDITPLTGSPNRLSADIIGLRRTLKTKAGAGTFTMSMNPNEMVRIKFDVTLGLAEDPIELAPADVNNTIPRLALTPTDVFWMKPKSGVLVNGNTMWIKNIEFDLGQEIKQEDTQCGKITQVSSRKTTLKMTFKNTEQNETPISDLKNSTAYNIVVPLYNQAGIKKAELKIPKAVVDGDSPQDAEGLLETERTFAAISTDGDDNFTFTLLG